MIFVDIMNEQELFSAKRIITEGEWYHKVVFDDVYSNGTFDYNNLIYDINFPKLDNLTVLDVGCSDGFFSKYFLESLNAKHVLGIDFNQYDGSVAFEVLNQYENEFKEKYLSHNDYQTLKSEYEILGLKNSNKFLLMKKLFNLNMTFEEGSIYDLSQFENFDVTFCGSLLEHLRDPITAVEQLYLKTKEFCIIDVSNSFNSRKPYLKYIPSGGNFFHYSNSAIISIMNNVGFQNVKVLKKYKIKIEKYGYRIPHTVFIGYK